jgi:hypothetical protein
MLHSLVSLCDFWGYCAELRSVDKYSFTRNVESVFAYPLEKSSGATVPLTYYFLEGLVFSVHYVDYLISFYHTFYPLIFLGLLVN